MIVIRDVFSRLKAISWTVVPFARNKCIFETTFKMKNIATTLASNDLKNIDKAYTLTPEPSWNAEIASGLI